MVISVALMFVVGMFVVTDGGKKGKEKIQRSYLYVFSYRANTIFKDLRNYHLRFYNVISFDGLNCC